MQLVERVRGLAAGSNWRARLAEGGPKAYLNAVSGTVAYLRDLQNPLNDPKLEGETLAAQYRRFSGQLARAWALASGQKTMLDYRDRMIVYRSGVQVRTRRVPSEADGLVRVISVKPWQAMPFATDTAGSAWASGRTVSFRSGPVG